MTNELDILRMAIKEYDRAIRIKKMNELLFEQLTGSLYYICRYCEKYKIPIPEKDLIYEVLTKCESQFKEYFERAAPTESQHFKSTTEIQQRNKTPDDETEPINRKFKNKTRNYNDRFHLLGLVFWSRPSNPFSPTAPTALSTALPPTNITNVGIAYTSRRIAID